MSSHRIQTVEDLINQLTKLVEKDPSLKYGSVKMTQYDDIDGTLPCATAVQVDCFNNIVLE